MYFKIAQNILKGLRNILELDLRSKNYQHVILPFTIQRRGGEGGISQLLSICIHSFWLVRKYYHKMSGLTIAAKNQFDNYLISMEFD